MNTLPGTKRLSAMLLVTLLLITPATGQQQKQPQPSKPSSTASMAQAQQPDAREDEITFDAVLAAHSYKLYGEVRMIGQLSRSTSVMQLLEPARLFGAPPKEVTGIIKFLSANADALATSRVMFAAMPARATLPQYFVAIEFASPPDAIKFEPKFRSLFSQLRALISAPPAENEANKTEANKTAAVSKQPATPQSTSQPVFIKRAGSLILMSDTSFALKNLRPDGSQPLASDPNFQRVRSRFVSEPLFLYYDVKLLPYVVKAQSAVKQNSNDSEPQAGANKSPAQTDQAAKPDQPPRPSPTPTIAPDNQPSADIVAEPPVAPPDLTIDEMEEAAPATTPRESQQNEDRLLMALPMLTALLGGTPNLPEAVGVTAALEGEEVVVRAMWVNAPGTPNSLIPVFPYFVAGPEIAPRASALSPADTGVFVSMSLDWPRIYDELIKAVKREQSLADSNKRKPEQGGARPTFENQIAMFEQSLGFKIKEDLLGALGNEVAASVPLSLLKYGPNTGIQTSKEAGVAQSSPNGFALFISLNDKDRVREMLPRVLEVIGLKALATITQKETRADIDITNYGTFSLAFIDDFLVITPDVVGLRAVIDAHENNQTLAAGAAFKSSTSWQSSRVLMQLYLASEFTAMQESYVSVDDKLQDFLARFNPKPGAITHAAVNDDPGMFHELHLPKDWVALFIAGATANRSLSPLADSEMRAIGALINIRSAQTTYKEDKGKGSFATRDQLLSEKLISKELLETEGYRIEMTVTGDKFEVTATPTEYGKTGRQSFYMDESGIIRGADHGGQPATVADKPL